MRISPDLYPNNIVANACTKSRSRIDRLSTMAFSLGKVINKLHGAIKNNPDASADEKQKDLFTMFKIIDHFIRRTGSQEKALRIFKKDVENRDFVQIQKTGEGLALSLKNFLNDSTSSSSFREISYEGIAGIVAEGLNSLWNSNNAKYFNVIHEFKKGLAESQSYFLSQLEQKRLDITDAFYKVYSYCSNGAADLSHQTIDSYLKGLDGLRFFNPDYISKPKQNTSDSDADLSFDLQDIRTNREFKLILVRNLIEEINDLYIEDRVYGVPLHASNRNNPSKERNTDLNQIYVESYIDYIINLVADKVGRLLVIT